MLLKQRGADNVQTTPVNVNGSCLTACSTIESKTGINPGSTVTIKTTSKTSSGTTGVNAYKEPFISFYKAGTTTPVELTKTLTCECVYSTSTQNVLHCDVTFTMPAYSIDIKAFYPNNPNNYQTMD